MKRPITTPLAYFDGLKAGTDGDTHLRELAHQLGYVLEEDFWLLAKCTPGTAEAWRKRGKGPEWVRIGNRVMYTFEGLLDFLGARVNTKSKAVTL